MTRKALVVGLILMAMVLALIGYSTNEPTVWIPAILVALMAVAIGTMESGD